MTELTITDSCVETDILTVETMEDDLLGIDVSRKDGECIGLLIRREDVGVLVNYLKSQLEKPNRTEEKVK